MTITHVLSDGVALFMLWLFMTAGISKLKPENKRFYRELLNEYGMTNPLLGKSIVFILGVTEILVALAILLPISRYFAAFAVGSLLTFYLIIMAVQLYKGKVDMDCGCAGPGAEMKISPVLLWRNGLLILVTFFCLAPSVGQIQPVWFISSMSALFAIMLYSSIEKLIANKQIIHAMRTH